MRKLFFSILCLCILIGSVYGWDEITFCPGDQGTCTIWDTHLTGSSTYGIGRYADYTQAGYTFDPGENIILCEETLRLSLGNGSVTALEYYVRVWTLDGNDLDTAVSGCLSDPQTGSDAWSSTDVSFAFSDTCSLSSGTTYAVVLFMDSNSNPATAENDTSNNIVMLFENGAADDRGNYRWNAAGTYHAGSADADDEFYRTTRTLQ